MDTDSPIYNSRIAKNYLNLLDDYYPYVDKGEILAHAEMTALEVEDPSHWFSQRQMDQFHDILIEKTGNPSISREAGRYSTSSKNMGPVREYTLGFMSPALLFQAYGKVFKKFSRNATISTRKRGNNKVEVIVTPEPGIKEKPYQCENRIGGIESVAKVYTGKFATVEHPNCFHKGHGYCRYIISWTKMPSKLWTRIRNFSLLFMAPTLLLLLAILPLNNWIAAVLVALCIVTVQTLYSLHLEKKELVNTIGLQKDTAQEHLDQLNHHYNHALLVHEIGLAATNNTEIEPLIKTIVSAMANRLDFDRGVIMLANEKQTRLIYISGYGYSKEQEEHLLKTRFHLDRPESKGFLIRAFWDQKPYLVDDMSKKIHLFSERSQDLAHKIGAEAVICVPIVFEKESLGILAVDNTESKRPLTQSDMNLLMGIASQTAVSISNARAFKKLMESEEKYRNILESIEDAYFEVNMAGNFTFFNTATCKMLGYEKHELLGMNHRRFMDKEAAHKIFAVFNNLYRSGAISQVVDWKLKRRDGSECYVQLLVSIIRDDHHDPVGFRGMARDVSERILADKERRRLESRLQQAEKMEAIGTLAGGVAHDLNNVLSGLVSYPELLLMDLPYDSPLRKPIKTIQESGERASAIVQDLLTLSRRGVAVAEVVNLNQVVSDYIESPEHANMLAIHPNVTINAQSDVDLLNIIGSPVHLAKSLMNIVYNAAESMPDGGSITIKTENRYLDRPIRGYTQIDPGEYAVLSVSDSGIGISVEDINRIFEPFYTKKIMGRSGSGLGMAVVWGTVQDHNGYIDVTSRPGEGTMFTLFFPATREQLSEEEDAFSIENIRGKGENILVVDDIEEQRNIAIDILEKIGYSADSVPSGEAAVEYLKTNQVDLIVLDMIMDPGMDGLQTYKQILEHHPQQKAVIASGYSETDLVREAQRLGAGAYVKKPYTTKEIGMAIFAELQNG